MVLDLYIAVNIDIASHFDNQFTVVTVMLSFTLNVPNVNNKGIMMLI